LGNYPNTTVALSSDSTVTPDAAPIGAVSFSASTSSNFKGILAVSPTSGVVTVTNAYPAGVYAITLKAFGASASSTRTFSLTVQIGTPCATYGYTTKPNAQVNPFPQAIALGDFNNDGKQDLVVGYDSTDPVTVRFGDGSGGFAS